MSLAETHPDIVAQWHPDNKKGPECYTAGSHFKAKWLCSYCGKEWEAMVKLRCRTKYPIGCSTCTYRYSQFMHKKPKTYEQSLEYLKADLAKQWHPTENRICGIQVFPKDFTLGSGFSATWSCSNDICGFGCEHKWTANISDRVKGDGCPFCAPNPTKICIHKSLSYTHPGLAKEWHPIQNGQLTPNDVSFGSNKSVWWRCPNRCEYGCEHEWKSKILSRYNGNGCPFCKWNPLKICKHQSFAWKFPDIYEKLWDKDMNEKSGYDITPCCKDPYYFKCIECSKSELVNLSNIVYNSRLRCKKCGGSERKTEDIFKQQLQERHDKKYILLDSFKYHENCKFWCTEHKLNFQQKPKQILKGHIGCPKCQPSGWSRAAQKWIESIENSDGIHIQHEPREREKVIEGYKVDGWCEETKTIYEFHGDYWHGNPKVYQWRMDEVNMSNGKTFGQLYFETCKKTQSLRALGYRVIEKWET